MEDYSQILEQSALAGQVGQQAQMSSATQYYMEEKQRSLADAQLEVESTLSKLYHLLRQDRWREKENERGNFEWIPIEENKRVLTEEGVDKIIHVLNSYINKENLLSNFDEKQIDRIMLTFRLALNANIMMKYSTIFRQPTFEEAKIIMEHRLKERENVKEYALEILGVDVSNVTRLLIKTEILKEVEKTIEKELIKIRE